MNIHRREPVILRIVSKKNRTIARTQEVGTTESVRDLSGDDLSSQDKALQLYPNNSSLYHCPPTYFRVFLGIL